ncbi:lactonase family protein [Vibrio sp. SCSIO 43135]|uniref:lactonase family protein n=1 Tax=Vibrio sp. SCSIO 43135 TaxID=2819096 RepID=UPI0020763B79|nr:lactonase family protein [Vibrio sp. SCSIO 43135]USD43003.1 lactonase family protein [Vibrio sp. SCSIO 43135]
MQDMDLLIGCYTDSTQQHGIFKVRLNLSDGQLSQPEPLIARPNMSYVIRTGIGAYAVSEQSQSEQPHVVRMDQHGEVTSEEAIKGAHPCHLAIDPQNKFLATAQYSSGNVEVFRLTETGEIESKIATLALSGSGPNKDRQTGPHAHQVCFLATTELAVVDLGSDSIHMFNVNVQGEECHVQPSQRIALPAGSGPRHMVLSRDRSRIYVVCELSETVHLLRAKENEWQVCQSLQLLPDEEKGEAASAIRLSPNEDFLYVSCRHQSKLACFSLDEVSGEMTAVNSTETQGAFPRDFAITPDGEWVIVANQHSNNVVTFKRDASSGALAATGSSVALNAPVCVSI